MTVILTLIKRNVKLFFKDKGMFFTSLVTPGILLALYATFLGNVYRDSFTANLPAGFTIDEKLIGGLVSGQLVSSILAVSCITVSFCSNFLMVHDRANGTAKDLLISPVKVTVLSLSYYVATLISTLLICCSSLGLCLIYIAVSGWYLSVLDIFLLLLDVIILVLFGTALSSVINFFLSTQGQISAVGTIISSVYGFICGAYMPIASFGEWLQKVVLFLPGTYGTSLLRNHALGGVFREMEDIGIPAEAVKGMRDTVDCNLYFSDYRFTEPVMYTILGSAVVVLVVAYVIMNIVKQKKNK